MPFELKKIFQNGACTKFQFDNNFAQNILFIFDISDTQNSVFLVGFKYRSSWVH